MVHSVRMCITVNANRYTFATRHNIYSYFMTIDILNTATYADLSFELIEPVASAPQAQASSLSTEQLSLRLRPPTPSSDSVHHIATLMLYIYTYIL